MQRRMIDHGEERKRSLSACVGAINNAGFECLSSMTVLQDLNIGCTKINDAGLYAISTSLTRLTKLNFRNCSWITAA